MDETMSDLHDGEHQVLLAALMAWHRENPGTSNSGAAEIVHSVAYAMWRAGRDWARAQGTADDPGRAELERLRAALEQAKVELLILKGALHGVDAWNAPLEESYRIMERQINTALNPEAEQDGGGQGE